MLRRATALLACGLGLQLSVVASDPDCTRHFGHAAESPAAVDGAPEHPQHSEHGAVRHDAAPATDETDRDCESPNQADCCAAVASCTLTMFVETIATVRAAHALAHTIRARGDSTPASQLAAPDPPPPRA